MRSGKTKHKRLARDTGRAPTAAPGGKPKIDSEEVVGEAKPRHIHPCLHAPTYRAHKQALAVRGLPRQILLGGEIGPRAAAPDLTTARLPGLVQPLLRLRTGTAAGREP